MAAILTETHKSAETWAWLQEHWEEIIASVPKGTRWAILSQDARRLLSYGDNVDLLLHQAADRGEPGAISIAIPNLPDGYYI
jgi:hypothetical protein